MKRYIAIFMILLIFLLQGCDKNNDVSINNINKLESINNKNDEAVMWLNVDNCDIDNPVFHGVDNFKYYMTDENGNTSSIGSLFLNYKNKIYDNMFVDSISIIYGYSDGDREDGEYFSKLKKFKYEEFALNNQIFELSFMNKVTKWKIFSVGEIPRLYSDFEPMPDIETYKDILEYLTLVSLVDFGVDLNIDDQILILKTTTSNPDLDFCVSAVLMD